MRHTVRKMCAVEEIRNIVGERHPGSKDKMTTLLTH